MADPPRSQNVCQMAIPWLAAALKTNQSSACDSARRGSRASPLQVEFEEPVPAFGLRAQPECWRDAPFELGAQPPLVEAPYALS